MKYTRIEYWDGCPVVIENGLPTRKVGQYRGNSGRAKPTKADGARDGDELFDTDTGTAYIFDEETGAWVEV